MKKKCSDCGSPTRGIGVSAKAITIKRIKYPCGCEASEGCPKNCPTHPTKEEVRRVNSAVTRAFKELDRLARICAENHCPIRRVSFCNYPTLKGEKHKSITYASVVHDSDLRRGRPYIHRPGGRTI